MGNKIIVEFDKERVKERCKKLRIAPFALLPCSVCKQSDKEQIRCFLMELDLNINIDYKIREQNNGNKGTVCKSKT